MKSSAKYLTYLQARLEANLSSHATTYIFLLFYLSILFLSFLWGYRTESTHPNPPKTQPYISIARGFGYTLNLNTAFLLLLTLRYFSTKLRSTPLAIFLPFDTLFPSVHVLVGSLTFLSAFPHAAFHVIWILRTSAWDPGCFHITMSVITGAILLLVYVFLVLTSLPSVRKNRFHLFRVFHLFAAAAFYTILLLHGIFRNHPETYKWVLGPLLLYLLDRLLRARHSSTHDLHFSQCHFTIYGTLLKISIPKPRLFSFMSGQYAELRTPTHSREWHPFTIASAPHESTLRFYVKNVGNWTSALHQTVRDQANNEQSSSLTLHLRGPFGAPCQHAQSFDRVVLVSGGVGATPFVSICTHLHHLKTSQEREGNIWKTDSSEKEERFDEMSKYDERVREAILRLFQEDIGKSGDEGDELRTLHIANMLQLTAGLPQPNFHEARTSTGYKSPASYQRDVSNVTSLSDTDSMSVTDKTSMTRTSSLVGNIKSNITFPNTDVTSLHNCNDLEMQHLTRQRLSQLREVRSGLLAFLHTTRLYFILLVLLLTRIVIICVASLFSSVFVSISGTDKTITIGRWAVITDTALTLIPSVILPLTILLELSYMGSRYFKTTGRTVDFFIFLPFSIFCAVLGVRSSMTGEPESQLMAFLHYIVFIPTTFVLLAIRMYRSVGNRQLLADEICCCKHHSRVPDVDFIWTTPREEEDRWLREEFEQLTTTTDMRFHRYVTRAERVDVEAGPKYISSANIGRPEWNDIFREIAASIPSNSVVGVFFCGPKQMEYAVKKASRTAEIDSHLRSAYLNSTREAVLVKDLCLSRKRIFERLRETGCGVRFVFRHENFI